MRLMPGLAISLLVVLSLSPLAGAEKDPALPAPDGAALWTHITQTDDYTKWEQWPEFPGLVKSFGDMGAEKVKVVPNAIAARAIRDKSAPPWPHGSIFVRQGSTWMKREPKVCSSPCASP